MPEFDLMKSYRLSVLAAVAFAVACGAASNPDVAASAGDQQLSVTRLADILGTSQAPLEKDVARSIAELWVNYQLVGVAAAKGDSLKESKTTSTLFVIADTDWLFDDYSVRKFNFFGQTAAEPFNDNLAFAANTLEFLGGSQDLISIRGKGSSLRPFTVVRAMEVEAQKKFQEKLTALGLGLGMTFEAELLEAPAPAAEAKPAF